MALRLDSSNCKYFRSRLLIILLGPVLLQLSPGILGQSAEPVSRVEFDSRMQEISNWGRWGSEDELGTLNLITEQKRVDAAALVRDGTTVSLSLFANKQQDSVNANPFQHVLTVSRFGDHEVAGDTYSVQYHGFAHSHMDGLPHFAHKGRLYNGFSVDTLSPEAVSYTHLTLPTNREV